MRRRRGIMGLNGGAGIPVITATATGNPLTFETDMVKPLKSLVIPFTPIQAAGTPSPDNPLLISGWTGANIYNEETYDASATPKLTINWQTEAGTIYGCTLTLNEDGSADLVADTTIVDFGDYPFSQYGSSNHCWTGQIPPMSYVINNNPVVCCEEYKVLGPQSILNNGQNLAIWAYNSTKNARVIIRNDSFIGESGAYDIVALNNSLSGVHMCCLMKTPITYHFDNVGQLITFVGTNNIWTDTNGTNTATYLKHQS